MQPLGTSGKTAGKGLSLRMGGVGMAIMLVVFLVAVVFAANENDVVGWLVVIISLGWLLIFSFVVFTVRSAARKASARIDEFNRAAGGGMAGGGRPVQALQCGIRSSITASRSSRSRPA